MKENSLEFKKDNLVEVNIETDKECVEFHVERDLKDIYKKSPYLFNKWIGISTQTWEGSMSDRNGKEISAEEEPNNPDRFSSDLEYLEGVPPKGFKFNKEDYLEDPKNLPDDVGWNDEQTSDLKELFEGNGLDFDSRKGKPIIDCLSESILKKNSDKLLSEVLTSGEYCKEVQYSQSTHYHGLSFLALEGKVYKWSKDTTLGDLLKKIEEK